MNGVTRSFGLGRIEPARHDRDVVELPVGQWAEVITAVLGPPPVKQPLHIDGTVLEKKPLGSQSGPGDAADGLEGHSATDCPEGGGTR